MQAEERESAILAKAKEFVSREPSAGKTEEFTREIDTVFAYDFDPEWNQRIDEIRKLAFGSPKPFNNSKASDLQDGGRIEADSDELWEAEIYRPSIRIGPDSNNIREVWGKFEVLKPRPKDSPAHKREIIFENGKYFERFELNAAVRLHRSRADEERIERLFLNSIQEEQARGELDQIFKEAKEYEAGIVSFNEAIRQLAGLYSLDPKTVRRAVIWGQTPIIPVEGEYILSEWKRGKVTNIMVMKWDVGDWITTETGEAIDGSGDRITYSTQIRVEPPHPKRRRSMATKTRIRTWTVYRLSRRGGGKLTEYDAQQLWDKQFPNMAFAVQPDLKGATHLRGQRIRQDNYSHQRDALLGKKQIRDYEKWRATLEGKANNT